MNDGLGSFNGLETHRHSIQQLLQGRVRINSSRVLGSSSVVGLESRSRLIRLLPSPLLVCMFDGGVTAGHTRRSGVHTLGHFAFAQRTGVVKQTESRDEVAL